MSRVFDLSIPLEFDGPQPNAFGAPPARGEPLVDGGFTGEVARGGSCECRTLTLTPHCNGTHTETVRHLQGHGPAPFELLGGPELEALLVSVTPTDARIDEDALAAAFGAGAATALIVRTLPNDAGKRSARWGERPAPWFTAAAMAAIAARFEHLLFDGPSLDRADDAELTAHRVLWSARPRATVTEMIHVPDAAADGRYRLWLQVPAFVSDAAPSRPLIEALG